MTKIDINKLPNKEITKFARKLAKTNTDVWNAICSVENLMQDVIIKNFNPLEEQEEFLEKLGIAFIKIKKNDAEFADPEINNSDFANFTYYTNIIKKYLK